MIRLIGVTAAVVIFGVASAIPTAPASSAALSSMFGVYVYPKSGQSEMQQDNDESICYKSARNMTGVDPANLPPATAASPTAKQGGAVRGAAGGAAGGAAIGAVAGNAGQGAAIGAVAGAIVGRGRQNQVNTAEQNYAKANAQAQQSQTMNNFRRAFSACLESKGYTAK